MSSTPPPPPSEPPQPPDEAAQQPEPAHQPWTAGSTPPPPPGGSPGPEHADPEHADPGETGSAPTADASADPSTEPGPADTGDTPGAQPGATRFVFVDTETTGLDFRRHELTEVAWIVRFEDGSQAQRQYFPHHTTDGADEAALELTHYHERIASQEKAPASVWLTQFLEDATGAVLVGAVPDFDARHLEMAAHKLGLEPTWDHHLLDVETLALPLIAPGPEAPRSLAKTCRALGVPHDPDQAHGALYDAQQAMRVFDAVWDRLGQLRADAAPLPEPVPRDNGHVHEADRGDTASTPADQARTTASTS